VIYFFTSKLGASGMKKVPWLSPAEPQNPMQVSSDHSICRARMWSCRYHHIIAIVESKCGDEGITITSQPLKSPNVEMKVSPSHRSIATAAQNPKQVSSNHSPKPIQVSSHHSHSRAQMWRCRYHHITSQTQYRYHHITTIVEPRCGDAGIITSQPL
jgi:hypothetical protein